MIWVSVLCCLSTSLTKTMESLKFFSLNTLQIQTVDQIWPSGGLLLAHGPYVWLLWPKQCDWPDRSLQEHNYVPKERLQVSYYLPPTYAHAISHDVTTVTSSREQHDDSRELIRKRILHSITVCRASLSIHPVCSSWEQWSVCCSGLKQRKRKKKSTDINK